MSRIQVAVIGTDNNITISLELDTLDWLQGQVGGYIEAVRVPGGYMFINEEGKIKNLPVNKIATVLADADVIVGNAVVVGPPNSEGDNTSLTPESFEAIKAAHDFVQKIERTLT